MLEQITKFLREHAPDIAKLVQKDMDVGDVHVPAAFPNVSVGYVQGDAQVLEDDDPDDDDDEVTMLEEPDLKGLLAELGEARQRKYWSDEARAAAAEARRGHAKEIAYHNDRAAHHEAKGAKTKNMVARAVRMMAAQSHRNAAAAYRMGNVESGRQHGAVAEHVWSDYKRRLGKVYAENGVAKSFEIDVRKMDAEQRKIFGWASISAVDGTEVVDKQGDIIPIVELEKAAHDFALYSRLQGDMHSFMGVGTMIESTVHNAEKRACGIVAKDEEGRVIDGWWVGFHVHDDATWAAHKRGDRPEFSIAGKSGYEER